MGKSGRDLPGFMTHVWPLGKLTGIPLLPSQAQMNGKHRKVSSQPSSCSQNTESSSTTPEPTNESSDNEGEPPSPSPSPSHTQGPKKPLLNDAVLFV